MRYFIKLFLLSMILIIVNAKTLKGVVKDYITNVGIKDVIILVMKDFKTAHRMALSDENGFFLIDNIEETKVYLKASKLGYEEFLGGKFIFNRGDTLNLLLSLETKPIELEEISIFGERLDVGLEFKGFYERRKNHWTGKFLDEKHFKTRNGTVRDFVRDLPSITVLDGDIFNTRGPISIYLNNILMTLPSAGSFAESDYNPWIKEVLDIPIDNIAGIEYYKSHNDAPSQFTPPFSRGGSLVIWLK